MVDARGGGLTIGLGLLSGVAVVPHFGDTREDGHGEKMHRAVLLAPAGTPVVGDSRSGPRSSVNPTATWRTAGAQPVAVFLDGAPAEAGLGGSRLIVGKAGAAVAALATGPCGDQSDSVIVTDSMIVRSDGAPEWLPVASIAFTTSSPLTTLPKSE